MHHKLCLIFIFVLILLHCSTGCNQSCAAGAYVDHHNCTCEFCAAGSFSNAVSNATSCVTCPEPTWMTSTEGSTACSVCVKQFTPTMISMNNGFVVIRALPAVTMKFHLPDVPGRSTYPDWYLRVELIDAGSWLLYSYGSLLTVIEQDLQFFPGGGYSNGFRYSPQNVFEGDGFVYVRDTKTLTVSRLMNIYVESREPGYVYNLSLTPNDHCVRCSDMHESWLNMLYIAPMYVNTHCFLNERAAAKDVQPADDVQTQYGVRFVAILDCRNFTDFWKAQFKGAIMHVVNNGYDGRFVTLNNVSTVNCSHAVENSFKNGSSVIENISVIENSCTSVDTIVYFYDRDSALYQRGSITFTTLSAGCARYVLTLVSMSEVIVFPPLLDAAASSSAPLASVQSYVRSQQQTVIEGFTVLEVGLIAGLVLLFIVFSCIIIALCHHRKP